MLPYHHRYFWILVCLLLVLVIAPEPHGSLPRAEAATYTVTNLNDSGTGSLRQAIIDANATTGVADVINFDVTGTITLSTELHVGDDLIINGSGVTLDGNNATSIMLVSSPVASPTVMLNDLIFQNSSLSAIRHGPGTLEINNSVFTNNHAPPSGGAIFRFDYGTLKISNTAFNGNRAGQGGAIYNQFGTVIITNSTFSSNSAANGGAIYSQGTTTNTATLTITNSAFSSNSASTGGAIGNHTNNRLTITGSTFISNQATDYGGAIDNRATTSVSNSTFSGNTADGLGGGAIRNSETLTITNSTFSGNQAVEYGGVIHNNFSTLTITNSTFTNNQADLHGGVVSNYNSTLMINSSTFSGNSAGSSGGTLYHILGTVNVQSSLIVDGNCDGTITGGGYNLSFNAPGCPGTVADPGLAPLQDNGGPTNTMLPSTDGPAVDAYAAPCATATDQRGVTRPQGSGCDIGATEQVGTIALDASAACNGPNLDVTIIAGDGPFNITASAGMNTPVNNVGIGTTTINGPEKWDDLTVTETTGDTQSVNLGQFKCRTDERPVPLTPAHRSRTTNPFPLFSWTAINFASNYRVFVFDNKVAADRTIDIRQNSGGPTSMTLSTPLPDGRLFWRVRGRTNRIWSLWSVRFTLFKDPAAPLTVNTPVPTLDLNPPVGSDSGPTIPAPPNSR